MTELPEDWTPLVPAYDFDSEWTAAWQDWYDRGRKPPVRDANRYIITPDDANTHDTAHGGNIVRYMDTGAGHVAREYSEGTAVTASIDQVTFHKPVAVGDTLEVDARLEAVGETSMMIYAEASVIDYETGTREKTAAAYFTFVAVDDDHDPRPVPRLALEDDDAVERRREAKRVKQRLEDA